MNQDVNENVHLNSPQYLSVINSAPSEVNIEGRGTGKSYKIGWEISQIVRIMPRSVTAITGRTFGQIYTRTLPSSLKFLASIGYKKDEDYVIGIKPPRGWQIPYETITKFDNFISFSNGTGFLLLSQEREGSARGPNIDREIVDEAITLHKERYDQEVSPANRGNEEHFGKFSSKPVPQHHGFRYVSSMPYAQDQKWLLDYGNYYQQEAGIFLFDIWNRIVKMQIQLIEAKHINDNKLFKDIWNEIVRLKKQITPFVSKSGVLFVLANAFDNLQNLGFSYILREYEKQSMLTFLIEILNWIIDKVEDCYYHLDSQKHIYYDAYDDDYIRTLANDSEYDISTMNPANCQFDLDCDPSRALEVVPDWGSNLNLFSVGQERNYNFATKIVESCDCFINEFFNKPQEINKVMITDLVDQFCDYYKNHPTKQVIYFRDKYGDHRQPNVKNSLSYNNQAIAQFKTKGWVVIPKSHSGMEPPQHDKYLLWMNILKAEDPRFPKVIFNGKNCKYTLISMNNTKVIERNGKFDKDKNSERSKKILPEEATHFSDAADKRIWTKYGKALYSRVSGTYVEPRL
jgi:hypothetical protein